MNFRLFILMLMLIYVSRVALAAEYADTVQLQGITVTAIKSGPITSDCSVATVITARQAQRLHIEGVKGVADVVPNVFVPDYGSRITSSIYVRGIGARIDQPAVGLLVDNVPLLNKDSYDFDLSDIASMKIIRGPQSALYGRNTMAGVIDITTLSPFQYQGLRLFAQYGRANSWKAGAGYYDIVSPGLGYALTVRASGSDGFFTNAYTGDKCDYEHGVSGRFKMQWYPSDALKISNTFAASWLKQGGYPYESVSSGIIAYNDTCSYRRTCMNNGLSLTWNVGNISLTSVTSWQYIDDAMNLDQDFLPLDYFTLLQAKHENAVTQDIVVTSSPSGAYSWLAGAFGFYKHLDMDAPVTFKDTGITQLIEYNRNEANPYYPIRWNERSFVLDSRFVNPSYGLAIYHQSQFNIGRFIITADLRLDYERASLRYRSSTLTSYEILRLIDNGEYAHYRDVPVEIDEQGDLHTSFTELLPKLGLVYKVPARGADVEVFGSVAKGYKSGGYNTQMFSDVLQQRLMWQMGVGMQYDVAEIVSYKPEQSWNYELGGRLSLMNGKLSAEMTAFYIDVRDQQLTMFPDGNTTGRIMTNAGRTHSWGFELSGRWSPMNALELSLAYGHTTARFRDFYDGKRQYRGNRLPYAPANTLFVGATYNLALKHDRELSFNVNVRGNGKIYWNESNDLFQPFYALMAASVTYIHPRFSCEVWGRNLTDTKYHTFYFVSIGHEFVQRGKPLEFGVTVNVNI